MIFYILDVSSFGQPSLTELAYTHCSTASILDIYINSPSTPVNESILLRFTFPLCQQSSCPQKAQDEWIPAHVKHSRCWEQDDSTDPTFALPLLCKAFLPHPISASSSPYPSLFKHFCRTVQHHIITPKLLLSFLSSRPFLRIFAWYLPLRLFQFLSLSRHRFPSLDPQLSHHYMCQIISGCLRNHTHIWIIRLSLDTLIWTKQILHIYL